MVCIKQALIRNQGSCIQVASLKIQSNQYSLLFFATRSSDRNQSSAALAGVNIKQQMRDSANFVASLAFPSSRRDTTFHPHSFA